MERLLPAALIAELQRAPWIAVPNVTAGGAAPSVAAKAVCSVTDGIGILATDIIDGFVAHIPVDQLMRQLRATMPSLDLPSRDALRIVQEAFSPPATRNTGHSLHYSRPDGSRGITFHVAVSVDLAVASTRSQIVVKLSFVCCTVPATENNATSLSAAFFREFVMLPALSVAVALGGALQERGAPVADVRRACGNHFRLTDDSSTNALLRVGASPIVAGAFEERGVTLVERAAAALAGSRADAPSLSSVEPVVGGGRKRPRHDGEDAPLPTVPAASPPVLRAASPAAPALSPPTTIDPAAAAAALKAKKVMKAFR